MQLRDYWRVLYRHWWVVLVVAAAGFAGAFGYSKLQEPVYRSTVWLKVLPTRIDYGLTMVIESLLRQYAREIDTDKMAALVNQRLKLDVSTAELRKRLTIAAIKDDYLLQIDVDDTDAQRAQDIAFVLADEYEKLHQENMSRIIDPRDRIEILLLDKPTPASLNRPKALSNSVAGGMLGLLLGVLLVFALEYLDDTMKAAEDVERYTGLPMLGTIPRLKDTDGRAPGTRPEERGLDSREGAVAEPGAGRPSV